MKSYTIKQASPWLYTLTLLVVIFGGIGFMLYLKTSAILKPDSSWVWVMIIAIFWVAFYLTKHSATAETLITMDEEGIRKVWKTQFLAHHKRDEDIKWAEIAEYLYQPDRNYDLFKMTLTDGRVIKIYHYHRIWQRNQDDFAKFHKDFVKKVNQFNINNERSENTIRMGKTFYESKAAWVAAIVAVVFLVVASFVVIWLSFKYKLHFGSLITLGTGYSAVLYFVVQVYSRRRKQNVD